jgi:hypothetical protein
MGTNKNKTQRQNTNRKIVGAIKSHLRASITLAGAKYAPVTLAKMFQEGIDVADASDRAAKTWHLAVAAEREKTEALAAVQTSLRNYVSATFGEASTEFADFGFVPRTVTPVDAATKANAVVLRAATRKARGTVGKKQKRKIKGTAVAPAEPADPATTTPAASSAASVLTPPNGAPTSAPSANGAAGQH